MPASPRPINPNTQALFSFSGATALVEETNDLNGGRIGLSLAPTSLALMRAALK